jgi:benzoyl-CoA 2,3-epoxidase subunit B
LHVTPEGQIVDERTWQAGAREWLPSDDDRAFVASLMGPVKDVGKFASWIAPPARGINNQPADFEYVRFN